MCLPGGESRYNPVTGEASFHALFGSSALVVQIVQPIFVEKEEENFFTSQEIIPEVLLLAYASLFPAGF
jgi:hypothetical protein